MKIFRYRDKHVKRTYSRASLTKEEAEKLLAVSEEWVLLSVDAEKAVFKPRRRKS